LSSDLFLLMSNADGVPENRKAKGTGVACAGNGGCDPDSKVAASG
jgi:hypothetical protein